MKQWIICDIDGTLCDCSERRDLCIKDGVLNWDTFLSEENIKKDKPNKAVVELIECMVHGGFDVLYLTGRDEKFREITNEFIINETGFLDYEEIYMRPKGDMRPDTEVKAELLEQAMKDHKFKKEDILFALDDRDCIVKLWRDMGITCFQVAEGDF